MPPWLIDLLLAASPVLHPLGMLLMRNPCCCGCDWDDDFSTAKSGYTKSSVASNFYVSGGRLFCTTTGTLASEQGWYAQSFDLASGLSVSADCLSDPTYTGQDGVPDYNANGVHIGDTSGATGTITFNPRWQFGDSVATIRNTTFGVLVQTPIAGTGTNYQIELDGSTARFYIDGVLKHSTSWTAVMTGSPSPLPVGVSCTGGGEWDNLCINGTPG